MSWRLTVLVLISALGLVVPSAAAVPVAGGAPQPITPAADQVLEAGALLTFQVQVPNDAYAVFFVAATSPAVGADGVLSTGRVGFGAFTFTGQPGVFTYTTSSFLGAPNHIGPIYWQAYIIDYRYDPDFAAEGPVQSVTLAETRGPLVGRFGISNSKAFYLNPSPLPPGVSGARFEELVRRSADRWGLRYLGPAGNQPGRRDRISVVGFDWATDRGALGVTTVYKRPYYRIRRVCRVRPTPDGGRRRVCRGIRRIAGRVNTGERDIQFSMLPNWQQGPQRPSRLEHDLESVIIHELGHFSGNVGHVDGCVNSPMLTALDSGEFWRDNGQSGLYACRR